MAYSTITKPADYFNTILWTGNGVDDRSITGVGFQPDWVWLKQRNGTNWNTSFDSVRGATKRIFTNDNGAEDTNADSLQAFESDGFQVGTNGGVNGNTNTYVAWNWLAGGTASSNTDGSITSSVSASTTSGFSIVSYTGTGSAATVGHGLGVAPKVTIFKRRNSTNSWRTQTTVIDGSLDNLYLNLTDAKVDASNSAPTSSVLNLDTGTEVNTSSGTYVAYCFAEKKGFSKFGSYTGNGSTDGTFVYTGFKPAMIIVKRTDSTSNWLMFDNKRDIDNPVAQLLMPNLSSAESTMGTSNPLYDFCSNGFKLRGTGIDGNASGGTYIYMAFAENPLVSNTGGGIPATAR